MNSTARNILSTFVVPALVSTCAAFVFFHVMVRDRERRAEDRIEWLLQAADLIEERYFQDVPRDQLVFDALRGMAARDRYSEFVDPEEYARFREENEGQYVGIGFVLHPAGAPVTVLYAFPGSPAAQAGLMPGDRITAVDGEPVGSRTADEVTSKIKLKNGDGVPVTLEIQPYAKPGETPPPRRTVTVKRAQIERPSVVAARLLDATAGLAYVRLDQFQQSSPQDLEAALVKLEQAGMKRLVLDLRGNRGGLLDQAVEIASLFIQSGVIAFTRGRSPDANRVYGVAPGAGRFKDLPLAVLVDGGSASASEIVAGALQDHLRAVLVGTRTYGKGMVQTIIEQSYLIDGHRESALLKITTGEYLTPAGRQLERSVGRQDRRRGGLVPDVVLGRGTKDDEAAYEEWLRDSEIPAEDWPRIEERLGRTPKTFDDPQLKAAIDLLLGKKVIGSIG
jgi:carboxyl-terminal processing protease